MRYINKLLSVGLIVSLPLPVLGAICANVPPNHPDAVVVVYNPSDGSIKVNANNLTMSSFQLESASGAFLVDNIDPGFCIGPFDVCTSKKLFTLRTDGVTELFLGNVLPSDLSCDALLADLTADGSLKPSGTIADAPGLGPYLVIPEPSAFVLLLIGCVVIVRRVRI